MDERIITKAMSEFGNTVLRSAYSITSNISDAEEVFSDVFFALFIRQEAFESDEHLKAWLIRVAVNKAKNLRSSARIRYQVELNDSIAAATTNNDYDLEIALQSLKATDRAVVYLHYYEGYSLKEIAKILSLTELGVRSRISRARKRMKGMLQD